MMFRPVVLSAAAFALALAFSGGAHAANEPPTNTKAPLTLKDKSFLDQAVQANSGELQLSLLAGNLAQDGVVKAFARLMVYDHTQAGAELAALADRFAVKAATGPTKEDKETKDRLQSMQGASFDNSFMQAQVKDHKEVIGKFQDEINSTGNQEVRDFASLTLGTLKQHLQLAQTILSSLTVTGQSPTPQASK